MTQPWQAGIGALRQRLAASPVPFVPAMAHGTMSVELFAPCETDTQQPHAQDELYLVSRGSGWFSRDGKRVAVKTGDVLFVPARMAHRFEDFSADFETWVVFWGPEGGEAGLP